MTRAKTLVPHWVPIYICDHIADTQHHSAEAHGAYMRLMYHYWRHGPIRDDDQVLSRITGQPLAAWRRVRPIIATHFDIAKRQWIHHALDRELEVAYEKILKNHRRTRAATVARLAKQAAEKEESIHPRNVARNEDVTLSQSQYGGTPPCPPTQARRKPLPGAAEWETDVAAAEHHFLEAENATN